MNLKSCSQMMGLVGWVFSLGVTGAVWGWDKSALRTVSPQADRSFPQGYEVVSEPSPSSPAIKQMPAGLAMVAAYLDVDGRRYYMTDWSYDRLKQGLSYSWIRPLGGSSSSSSGGYRITGLPAGETLNIRTGPGTNFAVAGELPNGKDGIQITGDAVMNGEAEWVPISYPGGKGWTRTKYLARSSGGGGGSSGTSTAGSATASSKPGGLYITATGSYAGDTKLWFPRPKDREEVIWSGGKDDDGYAAGNGRLTLLDAKDKREFYTGLHTMKRGRMDGFGIIFYPLSGAYYLGDLIGGDEEGQGRMIYPNGAVYDGQWSGAKWHGKGAFYYPDGSSITGVFKDGALTEKLSQYRALGQSTDGMAAQAGGQMPLKMDPEAPLSAWIMGSVSCLTAVAFQGRWIKSTTSRKEVGFDPQALQQAQKDARFYTLGSIHGEYEKATLQRCFPNWVNGDCFVLSLAMKQLDNDEAFAAEFLSGSRSASEDSEWVRSLERRASSIQPSGNSKITTDKDEEILEFAKHYAMAVYEKGAAGSTAKPVVSQPSAGTSSSAEALRLGATLREWLPSRSEGSNISFVSQDEVRGLIPGLPETPGRRYFKTWFNLEETHPAEIVFTIPDAIKKEDLSLSDLPDAVSLMAIVHVKNWHSEKVYKEIYGEDASRAENPRQWTMEETDKIYKVLEERIEKGLQRTLSRFAPGGAWSFVKLVDEKKPDEGKVYRNGTLQAQITRTPSNQGAPGLVINPWPSSGQFIVVLTPVLE